MSQPTYVRKIALFDTVQDSQIIASTKVHRHKIHITYIFGIVKFPALLNLSHWIMMVEAADQPNRPLRTRMYGGVDWRAVKLLPIPRAFNWFHVL